ncbi:MAG: hypothetical protein FWD60_10645 [Candidatus Azobacteroides sp.]|nr:hypothetical protein [Candidatus Azobacteroides sp.]
MKSGSSLLGGIFLGTLVGVGIGYLIGIDSEKRQQWLKYLNQKIHKCTCCCCGDTCNCGDDCTCGCKDKPEKDK